MNVVTDFVEMARAAAEVSVVDASAVGVACVLLAVLLTRRRRPLTIPASDRPRRTNPLITLGTLIAAAMATAASGSGMWVVFGHAGVNEFWRLTLFSFLEVAILVSALLAREALRREGRTGADGRAVWVLATLSGVISSLDTSGGAALVLARLAAPLVAAWLWERTLAGDRAHARTKKAAERVREAVTRLDWRRLLVRVGIPVGDARTLTEVERDRAIADFGKAQIRLGDLREEKAGSWRLGRARRKRDRAKRRLPGLGHDRELTQLVRMWIAAERSLDTATTAEALADLDPWAAPDPANDPAVIAAEAILAEAQAERGQMLDHLAAMSARIDRQAADSRQESANLRDQLGGYVRDLSSRVAMVEHTAEAARAASARIPAPVGAYDARRPGGEVPSSARPTVGASAPSSPSASARPMVQGTAALAASPVAEVVVPEGSTRVRVFAVLDQISAAGDPREVPELAAEVRAVLLPSEPLVKVNTVEKYVRDWRAEIDAGERPATGRHLRSVLLSTRD